MVIIRASGRLLASWDQPDLDPALQSLIQAVGVGGLWVQGSPATEALLTIQRCQSWASLPLLVGADLMTGLGARFPGTTELPPPYCLHWLKAEAANQAQELGRITAREAAALGVNWLLAPVTDLVLSSDDLSHSWLPLHLSFGRDPATVGQLVKAWITGAQTEAVLTTAHYFPGYSHISPLDPDQEWPQLQGSLSEWTETRWIPLHQAIAAGVGGIMTSHVVVPELDATTPATFSATVLRTQLRPMYTGLIISDALDQLALVGSSVEYAVQAVRAGVDMVLAPPDPVATVEAICAAVEQGEIAASRIEESVTRILKAKATVCPGARESLEDSWPRLKESNGARTAESDWGRGVSTDQLQKLILEEPSGATLKRLLPTLRTDGRSAALLQSKLKQPDAQHLASKMTRAAVRGAHLDHLPLQDVLGWVNWIWIVQGSDSLPRGAPAISIPQRKGMVSIVSDYSTPLFLIEHLFQNASALIIQWFLSPQFRPEYEGVAPGVQYLCQEHLGKINGWICYGAAEPFAHIVPLVNRAASPIPVIQALDVSATTQAEVMRKVFA